MSCLQFCIGAVGNRAGAERSFGYELHRGETAGELCRFSTVPAKSRSRILPGAEERGWRRFHRWSRWGMTPDKPALGEPSTPPSISIKGELLADRARRRNADVVRNHAALVKRSKHPAHGPPNYHNIGTLVTRRLWSSRVKENVHHDQRDLRAPARLLRATTRCGRAKRSRRGFYMPAPQTGFADDHLVNGKR